MINVVDVTHHYGVKPVLRGVNLTVGEGDVVAAMGPNGMGKSMLLALMAGILWPIKGHIEIDGMRRRFAPDTELEIRKRVIYPPADYICPGIAGRESVLALGRLYGIDEACGKGRGGGRKYFDCPWVQVEK